MAVLDQYTYILAIGVLFAFLDGWNIGANDVANAFATSVSSRSLTLIQAMAIASVCEFGGAILAGSRVTSTIKSDIIAIERFEANPSVLMLGMLCALVGSSTYLTVATKIGLPVSTTHCIIGGIIGVGFATVGAQGVDWSWGGVSQVFAAWGIAPCVAGCFGAILFTFTKYVVLRAKNPLRVGMATVPIYFGITSGILTMLIVWKGAANLDLDDWSAGQILGCIFGVAFGVAGLAAVFLLPYIYRKLELEDWSLRGWEVIYGPLLLRRGPVPPRPEGVSANVVQDYYRGHKTREELERNGFDRKTTSDLETTFKAERDSSLDRTSPEQIQNNAAVVHGKESAEFSRETCRGTSSSSGLSAEELKRDNLQTRHWYSPANLIKVSGDAFLHGVRQDVVSEQNVKSTGLKGAVDRLLLGKNGALEAMHARVEHFDNKIEHMFSFLQVMTAATASFAHGANDVSNAMGPLSAIYTIWTTGTTGEDSEVPIWILAFGGAAIVVGLWTYGYNLMRNLGNRITLHSPSRGFCMELGAAVTVVMATRLELPVSTTQCIIGATVGVGLCAGDWRAINFRVVSWSYFGWFITLPCTALIAGCLMGFVINAPQWGRLP